jgi:uncharacterized cupin superfamily protein
MRRLNLSDPDFTHDDEDPEGFRAGLARPGPGWGAKTTGISVYELPPGQSVCPYHYEYGSEEWLLVLDGRPTLRHPGGSDELAPRDLVFFPPGPDGAHRVSNDTEATVRVLMFSDVVTPDASVYPDSNKIGLFTGNPDDDILVRRDTGLEYYDGEA